MAPISRFLSPSSAWMSLDRSVDGCQPLSQAFFLGSAAEVAQALVGCLLVHTTREGRTAGWIVETEAYDASDPASHSCRGRTPRNAAMFERGGCAYVYRSYGIHWCINAVTGPQGHGAAVLLRALEPVEGLALMAQRRGLVSLNRGDVENREDLAAPASWMLARGPGCLTQAMGIGGIHNGRCLLEWPLQLYGRPPHAPDPPLGISARIGIRKAVEVPWRFYWDGNPYVSGPRSQRVPSVCPARAQRVPSVCMTRKTNLPV